MTRPPSILWLNTDHQLFANRPDAAHRLPLQTRLSRSGFAFTRAYTVLPICSPARASMLTGLYPHNHGLTENDGRFGGRSGLEPSDTLVTCPLAQADYRVDGSANGTSTGKKTRARSSSRAMALATTPIRSARRNTAIILTGMICRTPSRGLSYRVKAAPRQGPGSI